MTHRTGHRFPTVVQAAAEKTPFATRRTPPDSADSLVVRSHAASSIGRIGVLLIVIATGCTSSGHSTARASGVLRAAGGTTPDVRAGYPGVVRAVQGNRTVASTNTNRDGSFSLPLRLVTYVFIGGWEDACAAPCDWRAGCGQSDPTEVTKRGVSGVIVTCDLK